MTISNNEIAENRYEGLWCDSSPNLILYHNSIFNNGWIDYLMNPKSGVTVTLSNNSQITYNFIYNNTVHGIFLHDSDSCIIAYNTIYGNLGMMGVGCGVYMIYADDTLVHDNTIYDNVDKIFSSAL